MTKKPASKKAAGKRASSKSPKGASAASKKPVGEKAAGKRVGGSPRAASANGRLRPGELDRLVLGYMRKNRADTPHTASAIGKGIERSSGAVANCLARQERKGTVQLVQKKPRAYDLKDGK